VIESESARCEVPDQVLHWCAALHCRIRDSIADSELDEETLRFVIYALRDLKAHEEVVLDFGRARIIYMGQSVKTSMHFTFDKRRTLSGLLFPDLH
jgi:hypothetical protein